MRELLQNDPEASTQNPLFTRQFQPDIGAYRMPGSPMYFSDAAHLDAVPAPRLGQHTDEILSTVLRPVRSPDRHAARPEDRRVTEGAVTSSIDIGGPSLRGPGRAARVRIARPSR
jgi:hypothetical protein